MNTADLIRNRFETLHRQFGKMVTPEPSKIRIEVPLKDGVGQYEFNIKKVIDNDREQGLDRNDVFVPTFMSVLCSRPSLIHSCRIGSVKILSHETEAVDTVSDGPTFILL